ncbi:MAG: glycosyltransferase family 2 protein [Faecousia sp.]
MKEQPLVSVIVPVYNVEAYLDRCLRSITGQTYGNLEVILVDDGSPDHSGEICDQWAAKDSRIRVLHQKNCGGGAARNAALDMAKGQRIGFVDSDDYIAPDMYEFLSSLLDGGADIAECGYVETTDDQAEFGGDGAAVTAYTPEEAMAAHLRDTAFRQLIWNKLYRRETVGEVRFPEGTKIDDEFFTYRVLGNAGRLVRSEKICYAYRQQPGSVMHQGFSSRKLEGLEAKRRRLAYLQERMPDLAAEGALSLFTACLYTMQAALLELRGEELQEARSAILEILSGIRPLSMNRSFCWKDNLWILLSKASFVGTCRLRNFLFERD